MTRSERAGDGSRPGSARLAGPFLGILAAAALAVPSEALAYDRRDPQVAVHTIRPRFVIDAGAFWRNDSSFVAVEVGIPYRELMFRLEGDSYAASFDLIVVLRDGDRQVTGDLWNVRLETERYADTRGAARSYRRGVVLPAPPGRLRAEVTVSEPRSGHEGLLAQEVEIPDLASEPIVVGKIWFGRCRPDSIAGETPVPPEPLLARRFGAGAGEVCAWTSLYAAPASPGDSAQVQWRVQPQRGEPVPSDRAAFEIAPGGTTLRLPVPIDRLWLGSYDLEIAARAGSRSAKRTISFEMDESTVSLGKNPEQSIALVRYIATGEEIAQLESASSEDRERVWEEFWKKRDPDPTTPENEFKAEFFRRVQHANEQFGGTGPGWRTDRGMIYIQYGPPDHVESHPHNIDGPPYEVWIYNELRRRFVFVDYDGFGRYELHTPGRL